MPRDERLLDIGERGLTRILARMFSEVYASECPLPIDDDAGCIRLEDRFMLVNIDGYRISDALLPWMSLEDLGWKSLIAAMSDIAAKGGRPLAAVLSFGLNPDRRLSDVLDMVQGVKLAAEKYGIVILGGDTNATGNDEWIDIAAIGYAHHLIPRKGAKPGDLLYTIPVFGLTGAALASLRLGIKPSEWRTIIEYSKKPSPPLSPLFQLDCCSASSDSSDGLAETLYLLAEASSVDIVVESLPVHEEAVEFSRATGIELESIVFYGGEEYVPIVAAPPECGQLLEDYGFVRFGRTTEGSGLVRYNGRILERHGWHHF